MMWTASKNMLLIINPESQHNSGEEHQPALNPSEQPAVLSA
jgi:hypothetical protein